MHGGVLLGHFDLLVVLRFTKGAPASSTPIHNVRLELRVLVSVGLGGAHHRPFRRALKPIVVGSSPSPA